MRTGKSQIARESRIIKTASALVLPQFKLSLPESTHGPTHWGRVWINAKALCRAYQIDSTIPCWFAFLHDSQRFSEGGDTKHGERAADWAVALFKQGVINITPRQLDLLYVAMEWHSAGDTDGSIEQQICWDADRLDLGRCGTQPNSKYLCTAHAKQPDFMLAAFRRSVGEKQ